MAERRRALDRILRGSPLTQVRHLLIAAAAVLLVRPDARATHAMGGELTYTCLGGNQYKVELHFYRDCNGVAAPTNCNNGLTFHVGSATCNAAGFDQCLTLESVQIITPICATEIDRCQSAGGTYGVEKYIFSKVVNLSAWAGCGNDWLISWELCCRNNAITSLNNPGNQNLYLSTRLNNTVTPCNNSPLFTNNPTPFYCLGQPITYNPGATDPDGDVLQFALIAARGAGGANLTYNAGYSAAQPIHNSGGGNAVVLDPNTGTVTCVPDIQQVAVVTYRVREFRGGVQVGEVTRDVQFVVRPCPGNTAPTASGINGTNNFATQVCAGQPLSFTINSNDVNAGQSVTMTWNNGIPGANFSTSGSPFPTGTFTWTPTVANLGNNVFTVSVTDNACPLTGSANYGYSITVTPPFTPANAGPDLTACGSVTLQAVLPYSSAPHQWSVIQGAGTFSDITNPNAFVTGLAVGTNIFQWTIDYQTCGIATDQVTVINYSNAQAAANAGPDQSLCLPTNSTTLAGNALILPATGQWTLISGSGTVTTPGSPTSTVTGLGVGVNRFRWTINNGPCSGPTFDDVFITVFNNAQPSANAGPDISICAPSSSVTLNGNALIAPATGLWTLVSGTGTITTPALATTTVTGLPVGVHVFQWTINNGPCTPPTTNDQVTVTVFSDANPLANAGADQEICTNSTTLTGSALVLPATGQWTLISGSGTITSPTSSTTTVTGLGIGTNGFQWTVNNGPCANGLTADQVFITVYSAGASPAAAGPDQSICSSSPVTNLSGNTPLSPATGTWTLVSGTGNIVSPADPATQITGLGIGTNVFQWTVDNGPCGAPTTDQVSVFVYDANQPAAAAGPDQSLCLPTTSATLTGSTPTLPATGTWTLVSGSGAIGSPGSPTTGVTGLSVGANVFRWTVNNGPCSNPITFDEVTITLFNNANLTANAGADQNLCSTGNSTTLSGSALISPATGTWTLVSGSGSIANPNLPGSGVSGLGVGQNIFQWTVNNGACGSSSDQVSIFVFDANNAVAAAGPDQSLCTPTTSTTITGSSLTFPATGTWTLVGGSGSITSANNPTTTVTGLGVGANTFQWSVNNGPCGGTTTDQVTVFIYSNTAPAADAGPDQDLCSTSNTALMTANGPVGVAVGTWTLVSGAGTITAANSPFTTITGLAVGQNVFAWTINNGPCGTTTDQVSIFVYDANNPVANAGPDQGLCTPQTFTNLAGSSVTFPAVGTWTLLSGAGTIANANAPNSSVSGLGIGSNVFQWSVNNGPCGGTTTDQVVINVFDQNAQLADAGPDQQLCSATSTTLTGNAPVGAATGVWTLVGGSGSITAPGSATTGVTGLTVGANVFQWSIDNGSCGTSTDQITVYVFDQNNPSANAGADQELCTPASSTTLTGSAITFPATGQWSLVQGSGVIASPNSVSTSVSGLAIGENIFQWSVNNGPCPNGITTDQVSVFVFDANNAVANAGPDQFLCTPTSTTTMAGSTLTFPATGTWTLVSGGGNITAPGDPLTTITALPVGVNVFQWSVSNGPCANPLTTDQVTITVYDDHNPVATAGADQEICVPTFPNTVTLNATPVIFPATAFWSLVSGTGVITDPNDPLTTVTGLAVGVNVFQWSVNNGPCANPNTTDQVTIYVFDQSNPVANAGPDQNLCTPITSTVLAGSSLILPATGAWTLVSGSGVIANVNDPTTQVSGLALGANVFEWTVSNGPCANPLTTDQVTITVFNGSAQPADAGPDQSICSTTLFVSMAGSQPTFPATGQWTVVQGTANFANATLFNTQVFIQSVGEVILQWNIDNGACGVSSDLMSVFVFDAGQSVADAGPDQEICVPVAPSEVVMNGSATIFPGQGTWQLINGSGVIVDPNDPNTLITGLGVGENIFEWDVDNGPCNPGFTSDQVSIFVFDAANPIANAGPDIDLCTPTNSTVLNGSNLIFPATGEWVLISGSGVIALPNTAITPVTGLGVGENIFQWTVSNGPCANPITSDQVSVFVYDANNADADAGPDQELCTPNGSTTLTGSAVTFPATGLWTLVSGTGVLADPTSPSTTVSGLTIGENIFQWSVSNGPCANGNTNDQVSVFVFDANNLDADAGADQELCTPTTSTTLNGSAVIFPAVGTWTLVGGGGTITDPNDPNTTVTGLAIGSNTFQWSVDNGPCANGTTTDQVVIDLFDGNAQQADAGADQEICSDINSTTLSGNAPVGVATGAWTVLQGSGIFSDATSPTSDVSGMTVGENIFQWTIDNGACGITTDAVSIFLFDANNANANAGPDQNLCTPVTSTSLVGSAVIFPAVGTWTLLSGSGTINTPNDPNSTVSGLGIGQNIFLWTVDNGPCTNGITSDAVNIYLFDQTAAPADAGPDQELCTPTTSTTLAGNAPVGSASGLWLLLQGTGSFTDPTSPTTDVNGLSVGENIFQWTIDNGACGLTLDQVSIFLFDASNADADAGPDQELCTPDTSTTLAGSALIFPATGTWSLVQGSGVIADANDPNTAVDGLAVGENIFQWSVDNGPCANGNTSDEVSIFVFDAANATANAGPDQQLCTPLTSTTLAGSAVTFPASGTWTLLQGTGTITDPSDPNTGVSGLTVGENIFQWTVSNGPCANGITTDQVSIFLFDENNAVADAGPDQSQCTPNTSTTLAGSAVTFPASGTWTLVQGTGVFVDASDPNTGVSGLSVGENILQWTVSNGPCADPLTTDQVSIFIYDENNPDADAGADQDLCTPNVNTLMAGSSVTFPASGSWTLIQGAGTITDPADPLTSVTILAIGENVFVWTVDNGPCVNGITTDTVSIFLFDANNANADAGADQELCTPNTSTNLQGSAVTFPATATWTLVQGTGVIADPSDPNTGVSGLSVGENIFQWSVSNGPCANGSTSDQVSIFIFDENNADADAGPDQELCTPNVNTTLAGSAVTFPASGQWTLVSGTGLITDPSDPNSDVLGLTVGENSFAWTVSNGPCANGLTSDTVSIFLFDENNFPAAAGPDQDLCTPQDSALMAGSPVIFPAVGTWTIIQGAGSFNDANDPLTTVTALAVGQNTLVWTVSNGPCANGLTSDTLDIFLYDVNNAAADAGPDQDLCTPTTSTNMQGSPLTFPATGIWVLVQGTGAFADPTDPNTLVSGLSVGENIFSWTVTNGPCANPVTSDQMSVFLYDQFNPDANAGNDQSVCTPLTSTTLAGSPVTFPATGLWVLISGQGTLTDPTDPNTDVTNLGVGENIFEWQVDNGPCANGLTSDQVSIFLFDLNAPPADAGPDQEMCTPASSTVLGGNTPTVPAIGVWTLSQGTGVFTDLNDPTTTVTGLTVGENILTWTIDNGICGTSSDDVSIFVFDENNPPADAGPDQELCTPQDSTFLAGNTPIFPAIGTWSLIDGAGLFQDANDPDTKVIGLSIGENTFVWTVDNGPCINPITMDTMTVILFSDSTAPANAGPDLEICLPLTAVNLEAVPPQLPAEGTWSLLSGTGTIVDPSDPATLVTGFQVGISTFLWTLDNGPCPNNGILTDTMTVSTFDPSAPPANAGPDQELCTPQTFTTLAGNVPLFPATGTWSLIGGTGAIADTTDPATTVTGLTVGENIFVWSIYNGDCGLGPNITYDTVSVFLFDATAPGADAGQDQDLCTPTNSTVMQGNTPVFPAIGTWTIVSGGGTLNDVNDPGALLSGITVGQTILVWSIDNGPCPNGATADTVVISLFDETAAAADAGPDQQICIPTMPNSVFMAGNVPVFPATGQWTLLSGSGTITNPGDPATEVTGLQVGENIFQWTIDNGPCPGGLTSDQVSIFVFDAAQAGANAGPDQQLCTPASVTTMDANAPGFPAQGYWTIVSGSGTLSDNNDPAATLSALGIGQTVLVWTIDNGPCPNGLTTDTVLVNVYDNAASDADAGLDQLFCDDLPVTTTMLANSPVFPAIGTWVLLSGTATIANANDPLTSITGLGLGENVFEWSIDNGPCGSSTDLVSIFVYDHTVAAAEAGEDQEFCQDVDHAELDATPTSSTGSGFWTLLSGSGDVEDPGDPQSHVHELGMGNNWFVWTVTNGPCGTTMDTMLIYVKDCLTLMIPDAFSPNSDGVNDTYVIQNLESYPENSLLVFNRWGQKVLDRSPYNNDWDGRSENSMNWGEELPESTYYYILDLGDGSDAYTGYIYLKR